MSWDDMRSLSELLEQRANAMEIYRARITARRLIKGIKMGKLSAIAERIKDTKERLEKEADKLGAKLDGIDKAAPTAFARGHAFIDSQKAEVDEIEDTLRQLSNLPLDESAASPGDLKPIAGPEVPASKPTFPAGS